MLLSNNLISLSKHSISYSLFCVVFSNEQNILVRQGNLLHPKVVIKNPKQRTWALWKWINKQFHAWRIIWSCRHIGHIQALEKGDVSPKFDNKHQGWSTTIEGVFGRKEACSSCAHHGIIWLNCLKHICIITHMILAMQDLLLEVKYLNTWM